VHGPTATRAAVSSTSIRATHRFGRSGLRACSGWKETAVGEPIVARGPFVMNTAEEISEAYRDLRAGRLTRR